MSVPMHIPPSLVCVRKVIHVTASRGDGSPENPERSVDFFYTLDGALLACHDPVNGPADHFQPAAACRTDQGRGVE